MTAVLLIIVVVVVGVVILDKALGGAIPFSTPGNVQKIAQAIAIAEGFYVAGSRPARNHNPGDMTQDLIGKSVSMDGPFVVYSSDEDGWENLYKQISLWINGGSSHATADSTIADISQFYTTTDQTAWATNVANHLGVSLDTPIGEVS
jgi:hypothetical protein